MWEVIERTLAYIRFFFTLCYCGFLFVGEIIATLFPTRKTFKGETILVTGGASGIGRLLALKFAEFEDVTVVIWDVNTEGLQSVEAEIRAKGTRAFSYRVDVTKREQVYDTAEKMKADIGKSVTVLVNNAGIVAGKHFLQGDDTYSVKTMEVNAISHFWTIKAFLPDMIAANHGHIITIASSAGLTPVEGLADYCASKAAAIAFHEGIRQELRSLGKLGVDTTLVNPYYINTGMFSGVQSKNRFLLPILGPEYVVESTVKAAMCRRMLLCLPSYVYALLLTKAMPVSVFEALYEHFGVGSSMDNFCQTRKLHDE